MAYRGEPGAGRRRLRVVPSTRRSRALAAGALVAVPAVAVPLLWGPVRHDPRPAGASAPAPSPSGAAPSTAATTLPGGVERRIRDVQGAGHVSPLKGKAVARVPGIVTAVTDNGFWMQDPRPDRDAATSEGVFVFTRTRPGVAPGHAVRVDGRVSEFRTGGARSPGLGRTEIDATRTVVEARGVPLPAPVMLGPGGRRPPASVVDGDHPPGGPAGNVESGGRFAPERDAIDFYESLEGMRVAVRDAVAVGPSKDGEIPVLAAGGAGAGPRTARGGLLERDGDPNPERILLDDALAALPSVNVGDRLPGSAEGVLDYANGAFRLLPTTVPRRADGGQERETTRPAGPDELAVATVDLRGLSPESPHARYEALAADLVDGLRSPDLVTVTGLRDNSGAEDDGTVAADQTVAELITAISAAGGAPYDWRSIPPRDNADGGERGANDHVGFLFRRDRGLAFVDRPATADLGEEQPGRPAAPVRALADGLGGVRLNLSPGRIAPQDAVWSRAPKPVAAELTWRGTPLIVIAGRWYPVTADDQPLFGRYQPPSRPTGWRRAAQARVVARFVRSVRAVDPDAGIIVAGDLNEPESAPPVKELLKGTGLRDLTAGLPEKDRYTAISGGNAQALDHILLSPSLAARRHELDIVHRNSEFADRAGERDPSVVRIGASPAR
ncbi:endonuclease/exonuclease/phosphatase family protein [Actinomadura sp. SCN-SB]|uniref:endonuclease/exonuclease/phosphatase family protein n=1 Tax=Actinomadura sp. SCN-SB TaxID=3373092 RepID=UPI0037528487